MPFLEILGLIYMNVFSLRLKESRQLSKVKSLIKASPSGKLSKKQIWERNKQGCYCQQVRLTLRALGVSEPSCRAHDELLVPPPFPKTQYLSCRKCSTCNGKLNGSCNAFWNWLEKNQEKNKSISLDFFQISSGRSVQ